MAKTYEIQVPTKWLDVSIQKYMDYNNTINKDDTDRESLIKTISVLCDIDTNIVEVMKLSDIKQIHEALHKLISSPVEKQIINKISIDGINYGFHPKLDEMTMGEYVDVETFATENDIAKMMSVLYRPIIKEQGNRYDIEPYDSEVHIANHEKFKKLSVNIGNPIAVFFWALGTKLKSVIQ